MAAKRKSVFVGLAWAGAASLALAVLGPARAEMPAARAVGATPIPSVATPAPRSRLVVPASDQPSAHPAALQQATAPISPGVSCRTRTGLTHFLHPLTRTARRLAAGKTLTIVAIGSSSTAGAGASSRAASYPSRLAVELRKLLPGHAIIVLNRGINGEETPQMMARFPSGVDTVHPQLVLWQLGTNSVLRDYPLKSHSAALHEGIAGLKASGADVVLIDPQYAPKVLRKAETSGMVAQISLAAKDENVDLFHRFAVMHDWYENQNRSFAVFISPDGLHMNDWGYACWAKLLASAIADAATDPVAAAAAH